MADFDTVSYMMGQKAAGGGGGGGSSTLSGLTDVDISNPTDGQTLVYNAESGKWENGEGSGGSVSVINGAYDSETEEVTTAVTASELLNAYLNGKVLIHWVTEIEGPGGTFDVDMYLELGEARNAGEQGIAFFGEGDSSYIISGRLAPTDTAVFHVNDKDATALNEEGGDLS